MAKICTTPPFVLYSRLANSWGRHAKRRTTKTGVPPTKVSFGRSWDTALFYGQELQTAASDVPTKAKIAPCNWLEKEPLSTTLRSIALSLASACFSTDEWPSGTKDPTTAHSQAEQQHLLLLLLLLSMEERGVSVLKPTRSSFPCPCRCAP